MATPKWIDKLSHRWNVQSGWRVILILIVFACTGFTVLFIKPLISEWLFQSGQSTWFSILYWIMILPVYNLVLLFYGFIFGQFSFFWAFERRFFSRFRWNRKLKNKEVSPTRAEN